jgi:hypothetical protein
MALTEEQQRFLLRYTNNKGDFYKTIETMGLELSHVTSWQSSDHAFASEYKKTKQIIIQHLKEENYMLAVLKINDALINGVSQDTVENTHRIGGTDNDGNDVTVFQVKRTTKNLGVPSWAIRESLQESSIVKAVNTLAAEGVIPTTIARKILSSANKISNEIIESFDISSESEYVNDKKVISLIQAAVLGLVDH